MKDCYKIVLLILFEIFYKFYNILNINDSVFFTERIFSYILIYFQFNYKFKIIKLKTLDKYLIL